MNRKQLAVLKREAEEAQAAYRWAQQQIRWQDWQRMRARLRRASIGQEENIGA